MGKGQATTIQVLVIMVLLTVTLYVILNVLRPWTRLDFSSLIASRIAQRVDEFEGVVGFKFNQRVVVIFLPNNTILVKTIRGIGKARVLTKTLVPSSAEGFIIYIVSNETHAYVTPSLEGNS